MPEKFPFPLAGDNLGSISLTETTKGHSLLKHLYIQYHYIRNCVQDKEISVMPISTHDNVADILTKPLPKPIYQKFVLMMNLDWHRHGVRGSVEDC